MDFTRIGERIRYIRKESLKLRREEFADLLDTNTTSIGRIERGEIKSLDISILYKISKVSGYTIDEIVNGFLDNNKNMIIKKINYLLNGLNEKELNYQFDNIHNFSKFIYSGKVRDLKTIKKELKK